MQLIGFIMLFVVAAAAVTALSVSLFASLPKAVLAHAEAHGRFHGLSGRQAITNGTRAGNPPVGRPWVLGRQSV